MPRLALAMLQGGSMNRNWQPVAQVSEGDPPSQKESSDEEEMGSRRRHQKMLDSYQKATKSGSVRGV